jgi:tetratricopeptide (TPR) repeat protein
VPAAADLDAVALALSIAALVITAISLLWWQISQRKQLDALLEEAKEAQKTGQIQAAEEACRRAVTCARRTWLRPKTLVVALYDLAAIYFQQGKLEQAEQTAVEAFAALRVCGASSVTTPLICLMAQIYKKLGKDLSAGPIFQVAIQLLHRSYGDRSIKVGTALHELGVTLMRVGVPERAIGVLEECIPIFEEHLGKDHSDVVAALTNLGKAQSEAGYYCDAERTYRRAIAIREATVGPDHAEIALLLNNLAVTYKRQERIPEALDCLRRALAIREAKLGSDHPAVGLVLNNLANCLRLEKNYTDAETAVTRAMAILENPPHQSLPIVLDSFAGLRAAQGRYEEADRFYAQCLKIHESRPSSNLLELAETCERYAAVLYKLQKEKQADALLEKVSRLRSAREQLLTPALAGQESAV